MAILRHIPTYSSSEFTFSNGVLVADASQFGKKLPFGRIYDDAADEGFAIRSKRTGTVVRYAVTGQDMNDGDVAGWHLSPIFEDERRAAGTSVLLIND